MAPAWNYPRIPSAGVRWSKSRFGLIHAQNLHALFATFVVELQANAIQVIGFRYKRLYWSDIAPARSRQDGLQTGIRRSP